MATKTANLYVRIEPDVKEQAENILAALGIPTSNAINIFYKQIILQKGLPFEVKLPTSRPVVDMSTLSEEELHAELAKGYADMKAGRTKPAAKVFAELRKDYKL
jgi:DNA-damage-inducible protein J